MNNLCGNCGVISRARERLEPATSLQAIATTPGISSNVRAR
ncbi:hypothetical protein ABIB68_005697 [Bradyrhizobium sp. F1.2.2]